MAKGWDVKWVSMEPSVIFPISAPNRHLNNGLVDARFIAGRSGEPVEINQSDKVIFHRLGKLLCKTDIRQAQLGRFGVCLSQLIPHARFEGIEPQSEGRQLKLEIIHFLRSLVVPLIHDECLLSLVRSVRRALCECSACTG